MMNEVAQAKRETDAYAKAVSHAKWLHNKGVPTREDEGRKNEVFDDDYEETPEPAPVKNRDKILGNIFGKKKQ